MNRWTRIKASILFRGCQAVGLLPDCILYGPVRWLFYCMLYRAARYRLKVVRVNLRRSFPEKTETELKKIEKGFYKHLAEVFIDTVDMASISRSDVVDRLNMTGLEQHERSVAGRDWIAALGHYGSWEYFSACQCFTDAQVAGVYKPLHSEAFDRFFYRMRTRFGTDAVPMKSLMRYIARHKSSGEKRNIAVGMIADQTPPWPDIHYWFDFLNQKTAFFEGVERLAVKFNMPVYFLHMRKTAVARYDIWFEEIYDGVSPTEPYEITRRYVACLETAIRAQPEIWMWSHRRWKRTPQSKFNKTTNGLD